LARPPRPGYGLAATSFAIALTVWYAGPCPGILAVVLSILPEQQSDQIFNAFFTAKRQGIGIGNRSIVELHGGLLWAQKTRGAVQSFCSTCRSPAMPLYDEQKNDDV
jgi:K+-sensing histidine kinase KdpD